MNDDTQMNNCPFDGRTALLFGGAKGIGRAVALEWARRGARLAVADIDRAAADATAGEIVAAGGQAIGIAADVLDETSIASATADTETAFGAIEILMNNVGAVLNGHPEDIPFAEWQRVMDISYLSAVRATTLLLPRMLARGSGHIVNTASFAGLFPYAASRIPYAAAKAAVISLSENLAIYCEPQGVRVSCLVPGPVMTDILASMTSWTPDCPMRHPGAAFALLQPEEVAVILSDGMRDGRIIIPSDESVRTMVTRHAASPDAFIRERIADFASAEAGRAQPPG